MKKALICFLFILGLALGCLPCASADPVELSGKWGELTWSVDETGLLVIEGTGDMDDFQDYWSDDSPAWRRYIIRSAIKRVEIGEGITSIGKYAFAQCNQLVSVSLPAGLKTIAEMAFYQSYSLADINIPNSVISIGSYAFEQCRGLSGITVPESVTEIGSAVFSGCSSLSNAVLPSHISQITTSMFSGCTSLSNLTIPQGVIAIKDYAFYNCSDLTTIVIPDGVLEIGNRAFDNCTGLTSIRIPASVKSVSRYYTFCDGCTNLQNIYVDAGNSVYCSSDGVLYENSYDGLCLIRYPDGKVSTIFSIPDGVVSVNGINGNSRLTKVIIPSTVTNIDGFTKCENLLCFEVASDNPVYSSIDGVLYYEDEDDHELQLYIFPAGIDGEFVIPDGVGRVSMGAFKTSKITALSIPASVRGVFYLSDALEEAYSLAAINVSPDNPDFSSIDGVLFNKDCTKLIRYPAGKGGLYAIPETVSSLESYAFFHCEELTQITIPLSMKTIGYNAFTGCDSIQDVYYNGRESQWNVMEISAGNYELDKAERHYVPITTNGTCGDDISWTLDANGMLVFTGTGEMEDYTSASDSPFYQNAAIKKIVIPEGITTIGKYAFYGCEALMEISIPESIRHLKDYCLYGCVKISNLKLPEGLLSIGEHAFDQCNGLKNVLYYGTENQWNAISLGAGNSGIQNAVLYCGVSSFGFFRNGIIWVLDRNGLLVIAGSGNMPNFGYGYDSHSPFYYNSQIVSVQIKEGVQSIGDYVFYDCSNLQSVSIPGTVTYIGEEAFVDCGLTSIIIPSGVTHIEDDAFWGCYRLTAIHVETGNEYYSSVDGVLFDKTMAKLIQYPVNKSTSSYAVPNGVSTIGDWAFMNCNNLTEVILPTGVTTIGECAFLSCNNLEEVTLPDGLVSIGERAFTKYEYWDDELGDSVMPHSLRIIIPDGVATKKIVRWYEYENVRLLTLPASVQTVAFGAFDGTRAGTVLEPDFVIPNSVTEIEAEAFEGINATFIYIPYSVKRIDERAFANCKNLKYVMFEYCSPWDSEYYPVSIAGDAFNGCNGNMIIIGDDGRSRPDSFEKYTREHGFEHLYNEYCNGGNG